MYRINITAVVDDVNKVAIESKPLHEKIVVVDDSKNSITVYREEERERRLSILSNNPLPMSRQVSSIPEEHLFN